MYLMKPTNLTKVIKQNALAREIGLSPVTVNKIFNQRQLCSKVVAYCITKFLDEDKEIEDLFIRVEQEERR